MGNRNRYPWVNGYAVDYSKYLTNTFTKFEGMVVIRVFNLKYILVCYNSGKGDSIRRFKI